MASTSARGTMNVRTGEVAYEKSKADKRKDKRTGENTKRDKSADKKAVKQSKGCYNGEDV